MALEVYSRDDIRASICAAMALMAENEPFSVRLAGALAFARHQALAFGLQWPGIVADVRSALSPTAQRWLDAILDDKVIEATNGSDMA
ncbi:MAG: hypothetical protein GTO14_19335 [Anaerolineales bacterium]|nr:hypothetical protein [Anaerolineales bacterium]